jgi:serine/threonine protein kinase/tetratricopeptide (TPR) repeat protein
MPAPSPAADRNMLFGILALQLDFIGRDDLIAAMNAWVLDKSKPLGQILLEQGKLMAPRLQLLEALVGEHLQMHQGDPQQSLAALSSVSSVRQALEQVADADVQATLALFPAGAAPPSDGTVSYQSLAAPMPGQRYRILRPHAKGGLAEVFVAEDTELRREVALKEIRPEHAGHANSRSRFVREAEIIGGLEHPGVVPIYGLGQYGDGRPFYAMRFIKGDNLKEAIQRFHQQSPPRQRGPIPAQSPPRQRGPAIATPGERNVAFRELLGRFVDVCQAVAYAHSRGVLHRDLKPGNIMLGKYGETLVVDWGLAKPVGRAEGLPDSSEATLRPSSADGDLAETRLGSAVGTPAFMSPEQAAGRLDQLGPASDIYSLGATLYAVLTGQPPFAGELGDILRQVQRGEFPSPRQVKADVPAALEAVCLKAMALKPEQRYCTALQLAEDIEHWLADEPVSAWPEPLRLRVGRWARQHRPLVSGAAAALLVALLALGTGMVWYQRDQAESYAEQVRREEQANKELGRAAEILVTLHQQLTREGGVRQLLNEPARWQGQLQQAQLYLDKAQVLQERAGQDLEPGLAAQWQSLQQQLTQAEADRQLAERLEKIRLDWSTAVEAKFNDTLAAREYPKAFAAAGLNVLEGDLQPITARIRQSAIKEQLVAALDDWATVARLSSNTNQMPLVVRLLKAARLADPDPWRDQVRDPTVWTDAPTGKTILARLLEKKKAQDSLSPQMLAVVGHLLVFTQGDAEGWLRQAQANHPSDFWLNLVLAQVLAKAKPGEAVGFCRAALVVRPQSTAAWNNLGTALRAQKQLAEAAAAYRQALKIDPQFALAWYNLGRALRDQKKLAEAVDAYRQALKIDPKDALAWTNLGVALSDQKKLAEAVDAYRQALKSDPKDAIAWYNLGFALSYQRKLPDAATAYQRALALKPTFAEANYRLGHVLRDQGHFADALPYLEKGHQLGSKRLGWPDPSAVSVQQCRALLQIAQRAAALVQDPEQAKGPTELMQLAQFCRQYQRPYSATRLYTAAFSAQPTLAEDLGKGQRYQAACAAILAALSQVTLDLDAKPLSATDKANLRRQALDWLRADLHLLTKTLAGYQATDEGNQQSVSPLEKLAGGAAKVRPADMLRVCDRLQRWQADPDLASLREEKALAKLPKPEQKDWRQFWDDAKRLDRQARACFHEKQFSGSLTEENKQQVHEVKLEAGQTYVFDLKSSAFNPFPRLEDDKGQKLAENDDIEPGVNRNARLVFTPQVSGSYRLVATAFQGTGTGRYTLVLREFVGKK